MIPVFILLAIGFASFVKSCVLHGKEKEGKHNGWAMLFALVVVWSLYYWAGLFDVFNI